jgi:peptidoglycan/LPS O-acetylase OafA/YrhL
MSSNCCDASFEAAASVNKTFSLYLDLVRFTAAWLVYVWHSNNRLLTSESPLASGYGHSAVIVFFVLSGFVIAYVTDTKERTWTRYAASRLSRVYSVALPAVVITLVLDGIGRGLFPALYAYPYDHLVIRTLASLSMLNEIWLVSITSFSNVPYWSIAFEFWYYVLFGLSMFVAPRFRWWALLAMALFVGPKILLMLPIWWAGVWLYRWPWLRQISSGFAWALVLLSSLGIVGYHAIEVYRGPADWTQAVLGEKLFRDLTFANLFVGDYLLAFLVFCNFAGMRRVADSFSAFLLPFERPIRWAASYTFTLYLLHQPVLLFWAAVLRGRPEQPQYWWTVAFLSMCTVVVVGRFTENRREGLRRRLEALLERISLRWSQPSGQRASR